MGDDFKVCGFCGKPFARPHGRQEAAWLADPTRNERIYRFRQEGQTYAEIGRRFGLSRDRIRQICEQQKRLEARRDPYFIQG